LVLLYQAIVGEFSLALHLLGVGCMEAGNRPLDSSEVEDVWFGAKFGLGLNDLLSIESIGVHELVHIW
jgi:hypothetical protein